MSGFFDDDRRDTDALKADELALMNQMSKQFGLIADLLKGARTVGDCKKIDHQVDELLRSVQ